MSVSWPRRPKRLQTKLKRLRQKGEGSWLRSKNLRGSWLAKDEEFTKENKACKQDATQAFLVGFEVAIEQASRLHPNIDYSQLSPSKTVVDGQLMEE